MRRLALLAVAAFALGAGSFYGITSYQARPEIATKTLPRAHVFDEPKGYIRPGDGGTKGILIGHCTFNPTDQTASLHLINEASYEEYVNSAYITYIDDAGDVVTSQFASLGATIKAGYYENMSVQPYNNDAMGATKCMVSQWYSDFSGNG